MQTSTLPGPSGTAATATATTPNYQLNQFPSVAAAAPSTLQLVPYGSIHSMAAATPLAGAPYPNQLTMASNLNLSKGHLTADQLTKLYNMNSFARTPNQHFNQFGAYQTTTLPQTILSQPQQQLFNNNINNQLYQSHITSFVQQTSQFSQAMTSSSSPLSNTNIQQPLLDKQFITSNSIHSQQIKITQTIHHQQQQQLQQQHKSQQSNNATNFSSSTIALLPKVRPIYNMFMVIMSFHY